MIRLFFPILIALSLLASCKWFGKSPTKEEPITSIKNKPSTEMPIPPLPLSGDYAADWKLVDSLESQGLFKSALEIVQGIYSKAQKDKNSQQVVKSLLYRGKYAVQLEEDGLVVAIKTFEEETAKAAQPEKSILYSILGQIYSTYLQNQGWNLQQRTPIPDGEGGDVLTWSAVQIEKKAIELYMASIAQEALLKSIPINNFRDITTKGVNDEVNNIQLRGTLFDLLAHRAVEHFSNEWSYLNEPAYRFVLNQPEVFANTPTFIAANFATQDSTSNKWLAIKTLQKIEAAQVKSNGGKGGPALLDAQLNRLRFVWNSSTLENKNQLYQKALEDLYAGTTAEVGNTEVAQLLATYHYYTELGDKGSNAKKAVAILEESIARFPNSFGAYGCRQLLKSIKEPSLNTVTEEVYLPNKNNLLQVKFRNVKKIWSKVVQIDFDKDNYLDRNREKQLPDLNKRKPLQSKSWDIQDPGDYQQHNTELALEPLSYGSYWVLLSDNPNFDPNQGIVNTTRFAVSEIASVSYNEKEGTNYVLAHRMTGMPLAGVKLDWYLYDYDNDGPKMRSAGSTNSNKDGLAHCEFTKRSTYFVRATLGKDSLWLGNGSMSNYYNNYEANPEVQFFTDRSLYRPGQTVYFKGLVVKRPRNENTGVKAPQIIANHNVTIGFHDVNGQLIGSQSFKSNEFGTFNGTFTAPSTGLTGQMTLQCEGGAIGYNAIRVEEYKRPRFEVTMKPVEGAFRLNEKITMRGEAKNYAGNAVDGAQVKYRVIRKAHFPFWDYNGYSRRSYPVYNTEAEIANGNIVTNADGSFSVEFLAIPDANIPKSDKPNFHYQVLVDVTDITGETHSNSGDVSVGYIALQVNWDLGTEIHLDSLKKIGISTNNLAGQKQAAQGEITLQKLVEPKVTYQKRLWDQADVMTLPENEFRQKFPEFAWKDEDDPEKWGRQDFTRSIKFNTEKAETVDLNEGRTQPGWYVMQLSTKDAYGETVEIKKIVRVFDNESRFVQPGAFMNKNTYQPGEKAQIYFGGKEKGLHFFFAQENQGALEKPEWISSRIAGLSNVEINIQESDRGGILTHWFAIKDNRIYGIETINIPVPWSNKELSISFETFRDKLAPGQKEEWRLKISGPKKDKVAAEMVAAMYDASLDQFLPHNWNLIGFPINYSTIRFNSATNFTTNYSDVFFNNYSTEEIPGRSYPELNFFDFPFWGRPMLMERAVLSMQAEGAPSPSKPGANGVSDSTAKRSRNSNGKAEAQDALQEVSITEETSTKPKPSDPPPAAIRRNLNETVFFFPEMRTDAEGNIVLKFTMNEALTKWKLLTFAHTKELQQALVEKTVVTQKELMVIANPPRFLRQGDEIEFSAKVSNLSQQEINGTATLNLLDASTLATVEREFGLATNNRVAKFNVLPGQSSAVSWRIKVPDSFSGAVTWQIFADGKGFRDGEESTVPVVSNRMLVTETLPLAVRGNQTKSFVFEHLKSDGKSGNGSLQSHQYTLEFSSNPVWYAVQSLPYLMEYPHECSEQIFSRFYANALASSVVEKMPQIKRVYERWKGSDAMKSNLSKNQELKYALLEETPWVLDAQDEEKQKQNIALLFDLNRMSDERARTINTLSERQMSNGGWPWFPGGQDSWYITQHILSGMMHLDKLGAYDRQKDDKAANMVDRALTYCDSKIEEQYRKLAEQVQLGKAKFEDDHLDGMAIQYLYTRSFAPVDRPSTAVGYYLQQAAKYWLGKGLYQEGMLALALHRQGNPVVANNIVASLRERATLKEELGMYWPVDWGYYWYQLPVETQALMVEVFGEVAGDMKSVEELRIWLLKNKQTNRWESTKATSEAVYALLLFGDNWLQNTRQVSVVMDGKAVKVNEYEAGTGYFKQQWNGAEIKPGMGEIKIENPNSNIVWGAAYWQYFEDLDKIKEFKKTPLTIVKQLYLEENTPTGPVLKPVSDGQALKRGDKIKVRIEIRVDRAMEFVHLKDMRAAGLEPINVLSGYRWQGGLGYYESTKDLATHFFIDYLPRGTFVFEYPLVVSLRGDMSNGITTMQCMYAPEFTTHSKGVRVKVE